MASADRVKFIEHFFRHPWNGSCGLVIRRWKVGAGQKLSEASHSKTCASEHRPSRRQNRGGVP
jgi:hypothetical protein